VARFALEHDWRGRFRDHERDHCEGREIVKSGSWYLVFSTW
jgi:hypothetical protein